MIKAKPKFNTFFALGTFLLLTFVALAYIVYDVLTSDSPSVWLWILLGLVGGIAVVVSFKFFASYHVVIIEKNRVQVSKFFGLAHTRLYFKDLEGWQEEKVDTSNGIFKQFSAKFIKNNKLKLSNQEHENYSKVVSFFKRHYRKKEFGK